MMSLRALTLVLTGALWGSSAFAVEATMTAGGYTGLGITPNARLLDWGRLDVAYDRQLPGYPSTAGHNYVFGFGLLPNLEVAGRLAANTLHTNCFIANCGARDLSASGKLSIAVDPAGVWRVGMGATDVGGAVTFVRSYYGVLTYHKEPFEVSAGVGRRSGAGINSSRAPIGGPFAGAAWQPSGWMRAHVEIADGNVWAGVHLFAPKEWLPEGWSVHLGVNQRLNANAITERNWLSAGLSIPLYKVPALPGAREDAPRPELGPGQLRAPVYEARTPGSVSAAAVGPDTGSPEIAPADTTPATLDAVAAALRANGFEDISVGRMGDNSVAVRANNAVYNWNTADAVGAALGAIARGLGHTRTAYRLVLLQRQTPVVAVSGQANCLRDWIAHLPQNCTAGQLTTPGMGSLDALTEGAQWQVHRLQPSWKTIRVAISPVLRTSIGSELDVLEFGAGVNVALKQPLWDGATLELARDVPAYQSRDYSTRGVFAPLRVKNETERLILKQTLRLPLERWIAPADHLAARRWGLAAVTAQATIGRVAGRFDGVLGELRWEPGEGRHRVGVEAGRFRNVDFGQLDAPATKTPSPLIANYRYNLAETRTFVEAAGGQFMYNDRGFQLGMRQWFSDVSVGIFYRRSKFTSEPVRQFAGVEITVPIGPRKDMNPGSTVQVTGFPRFTYAKETTLREQGVNPVRLGFGVRPPVERLDATFNSDRAGLAYFEDNIRRIRDAARAP